MAPAAAHDDVASGGRRRGRGRRRNLSWGAVFCFGSQEASSAEETTTTPWERFRRRSKKRTVPVDGDLVGTAADSEVIRRRTGTDEDSSRKRKGLRLPGCCFLAPHSAMDSSSSRNKQRHPERTDQPPPSPPLPRRSQSDKNSPSEAPRIQATTGGSTSNGSRYRGAEQPRGGPPAETTRAPTTKPSETGADGVGSFGPVVGLSVVVAVSMAGLLGGRLWAVACVCAWLAALSRLRRTEATTAAAGDVDWTDHKEKEPVVVLGGLLERDRRTAVAASASKTVRCVLA